MANFRTHISTSAILGVGYGAVGHTVYGMPLTSSVLSAGLCAVAGMLPDVDADRGHSLSEIMAFLAAVVPLFLLDRAQHLGYRDETLVVLGALVYVLIRFGLANLIRHFTVHRGMWHSIPAALIAGLVTFWLCDCPVRRVQIYKAAAVVTGYVWHLVLDEIYAVDTSGYKPRVKRSFQHAFETDRLSHAYPSPYRPRLPGAPAGRRPRPRPRQPAAGRRPGPRGHAVARGSAAPVAGERHPHPGLRRCRAQSAHADGFRGGEGGF